MKIHAHTYLPPPAPPAAAAPPKNEQPPPSVKARAAFDEALEAKPASDPTAQAGRRNRGDRSDAAASRREPESTPTSSPDAAAASAEEPDKATTESPYAPGSIIDIEA